MFIKISNYKNITGSFSIIKDDLICWKEKFLTSIDLFNSNEKWINRLVNTHQMFFLDGEYIYPFTRYKSIKKISAQNGIEENSLLGDISPINVCNEKLFIEYNDGTNIHCSCLDVNSFEITPFFEIKKGRISFANTKYVILRKSNLLFCHSLTTGQELWQADVSEIGQYTNINNVLTLGTVEELFPVGDAVVAKIDALALAAFSLHDGSVKWEYRFKMGYMYKVALFDGYFHVFADDYYRIEASTGRLAEQKPYREMFSAANMKPYWYTGISVDDKYIAVSSHYDSAILLIDRATFTIAQRIDLEGCKNGIPLSNAPRLHGNRLFQLDGDGTLHVFEEE